MRVPGKRVLLRAPLRESPTRFNRKSIRTQSGDWAAYIMANWRLSQASSAARGDASHDLPEYLGGGSVVSG